MEYDTSGRAGLILRRAVQLRAEIIDLNQPELHKGSQFHVETTADGGSEGSVGAKAEGAWADGSYLRTSDGNRVLRFPGHTKQRVHKG